MKSRWAELEWSWRPLGELTAIEWDTAVALVVARWRQERKWRWRGMNGVERY